MFSNLFGKKTIAMPKKKFFPQNRLEALLMQAANDPAVRPEFYKELLAADLYVLILPGEHKNGKFIAEPGEQLSIKGMTVDGRRLIPVFSCEFRLQEYIQGPDHLAKMNGRVLFSMIAGTEDGAVLNPASSYGKEFSKSEIAALVDGSLFSATKQVLSKEMNILVGAPKEYPQKAVDALISYCQDKPELKKAYVAQIHMPDSGEAPHLLFAFLVDGDFETLVSDFNVIFREAMPGQIADLIQLGQGSMDDYFNKQEPFFQR